MSSTFDLDSGDYQFVRESRKKFTEIFSLFEAENHPSSYNYTRTIITIAARDGASIPLWVYQPLPLSPPSSDLEQSLRPLFFVSHGGCWMSGNPVLEEGFTLTKLLGSLYTEVKGGNEDQRPVIIAPDYRLIPENAYPIPINDTIDALQYAVANASTYGADSSRIILGGSSAGGHLTLVLALEVMEDNIKGLRKESLKALFLTVPMLCHPFHWQILFPSQPAPPSYKRVPEEFMGGSMAKRFWTRLATDHPPNDWRVSPLLGDFTGLPRVELFVAEGCPFVDEGKELSTRLEAKGVQVRTREYKRVQHMFIMSKDLAETKRYEEEYFQSWNEVLQHSR